MIEIIREPVSTILDDGLDEEQGMCSGLGSGTGWNDLCSDIANDNGAE